MRRSVTAFILMLFVTAGPSSAQAPDAKTIAAVNASSNALDDAFAARDVD
jgi:hypothetical protein